MATEIALEARSVLHANSNHQEPLSTFKPVVLEVSQHSLPLRRAAELVTVNYVKICQSPCDCVPQTIQYIQIQPHQEIFNNPIACAACAPWRPLAKRTKPKPRERLVWRSTMTTSRTIEKNNIDDLRKVSVYIIIVACYCYDQSFVIV